MRELLWRVDLRRKVAAMVADDGPCEQMMCEARNRFHAKAASFANKIQMLSKFELGYDVLEKVQRHWIRN